MATGHGSSLGRPKERRPNGRRRVEAIWEKNTGMRRSGCGRVAGVAERPSTLRPRDGRVHAIPNVASK
ncbi:hypothetical protein LC55x_3110 [Lysobacter capsici]|nr:hypothetical protein LC55x_3110 [Lysobacter capsici]